MKKNQMNDTEKVVRDMPPMTKRSKILIAVVSVVGIALICVGVASAVRNRLAASQAPTDTPPVDFPIDLLPTDPGGIDVSTPIDQAELDQQATAAAAQTATQASLGFPTVTRRPSITPTRTRTGTLTPATATFTQTVTKSVTPSITPIRGGCENVLFPLKNGRAWDYTVSVRGNTYALTMNARNVSNDRATVVTWNGATGATTSAVVDCDRGALVNMPLTVFDMVLDDFLDGEVTTQYVSGVMAPSRTAFEASNWNLSWSGRFAVDGYGVANFQGNDYVVIFDQAPLIVNCQSAGLGSPTSVNPTLNVICSYDVPATVGVNGIGFTGRLLASSSQQFILDVGLNTASSSSVTMDFLLMDINVPINASVILNGYFLGP